MGWGGRRANSGRKRVTQKVRYLRSPILFPRDTEEKVAMSNFMKMNPEERLRFVTDVQKLLEEKGLLKRIRQDYYVPARIELGDAFQHGDALEIGLIAGLDYQQTKLRAYAAYLSGAITRDELDTIIGEES